MKKVRIFVDHANFDIAWQEEFGEGGPHIAWERLPKIIMDRLMQRGFIHKGDADLRGITVYASTHPEPDEHERKRERWLRLVLDQMPGYTVKTAVRQRQPCDHGVHLEHFVEKGVDTMLVCDMLSLAMRDFYDLGVVISNDSDLIPSIQTVQDVLDRQIVHVGFGNSGQAIRSAAWGHVLVDGMKGELRGTPRRPRRAKMPATQMAAAMKAAMTQPKVD